MTAPKLSPADILAATDIAGQIGAGFKAARLRAGDQQKNVAYRLGVRTHIVTRFEAGREANLKLGRAIRLLRLYNLTLAVVPAHSEAE